jgi:HD-GYP domain-containing protein (c-di-GMP phosphodiesterase class II)
MDTAMIHTTPSPQDAPTRGANGARPPCPFYWAQHAKRVSELSAAIAKRMALADEDVEGLRLAGFVHDIGNIYIPPQIMAKPGGLSEVEMHLIKTHPQNGYAILKGAQYGRPIAEIVLQHHERADGTGYPRHLTGEEILTEAKIIAVADTVEAMASFRPYRSIRGVDAALAEIQKGRGTLYDATVVEECVHLFEKDGFHFDGID